VRGATRSGCTVSGESVAGRRRVRNKVWFCDATDLASLPATPQAVALNLAELVEKQKVAPCAGASLRPRGTTSFMSCRARLLIRSCARFSR